MQTVKILRLLLNNIQYLLTKQLILHSKARMLNIRALLFSDLLHVCNSNKVLIQKKTFISSNTDFDISFITIN